MADGLKADIDEVMDAVEHGTLGYKRAAFMLENAARTAEELELQSKKKKKKVTWAAQSEEETNVHDKDERAASECQCISCGHLCGNKQLCGTTFCYLE